MIIPYSASTLAFGPFTEPSSASIQPAHLQELFQILKPPSPQLQCGAKKLSELAQPFFWNEERKGVIKNLNEKIQSHVYSLENSFQIVRTAKAKVAKCEKHLQRLRQNVASCRTGKAGRAKKAALKMQIDVHAKSLQGYSANLTRVAKKESDNRARIKSEIGILLKEIARVDLMEPPEFKAPDTFFGPEHNWNGRKVRLGTQKRNLLF